MNNERINMFCGQGEMKPVDAMERIDANARGILFVVNEKRQLMGVVSDGDIRRWLTKTADLKTNIGAFMNASPKYLHTADKANAISYMKKIKIRTLPIVDETMKIVDIVSDDDEPVEAVQKNSLCQVPVIIMAGGKGTRLYPYTKILPKPLIPIGDIPILERIINKFCEYGIAEYYMSVNYKKGMIKSYFADMKPDYSVVYVEEDKPLGTAGSIKLIEKDFEVPVIVTNCDVLIHADYEDIYRHHCKSGNKMTIVSAVKNIEVPYGVLRSEENGIVVAMEEKPKLSYLVNTGMYIVDPDMLEKIPEDIVFHMTDLADLLMKEGLQVGMYPISEESFWDMGEFEEMRRMEEKLNVK